MEDLTEIPKEVLVLNRAENFWRKGEGTGRGGLKTGDHLEEEPGAGV